MGIESFSIENEGPIEYLECDDVPQLMIIAGPNGVGKSTTLEKITDMAKGHETQENIEVTDEKSPLKVIYFSPHRAPVDVELTRQDMLALKKTSTKEMLSQDRFNIYERSGMNANYSTNIRHFKGHIRSKNRPDVAPYYEFQRRMAQFENHKRSLVNQIHEERGQVPADAIPEYEEPLKEAVNMVLPGIKYNEVEITDGKYNLTFIDRSGEKVNFYELSSGEKDLISIIFLFVEEEMEEMLEIEDSEETYGDPVILIDGPETFLHPAMQKRLFNFIKENQEDNAPQVLMTTHSKAIIENTNSEDLYFLHYPDQSPENQMISSSQISGSDLDKITNELGITAISSGNPILLVEGDSDRDILSLMYPKLSNEFEIVPLGGKDKVLGLSDALNELIPELESVGMNLFGVVDKDRDVNLKSDYKDRVHQLEVSCIENYLLNPESIFNALRNLKKHQFITEKGVENKKDINDQITDIINTEDFKNHVIRKRVNEKINFAVDTREANELTQEEVDSLIDEIASKKKERLAGILNEVKTKVDELIQKRSLKALDGKRIISHLSKRFNVNSEALIRSIASQIKEDDKKPPTLDKFMEKIMKVVSDEN